MTDTIAGKAMALDDEAKLFAATHKVVQWRALACIWLWKAAE